MYRKRKRPSTRFVLLVMLMALILAAGCAAPQATPAQTDEATPTHAAVSTATEPPTLEAAVATEIVTVTTMPAEAEVTPPASGETGQPEQEVAYEFPVKGRRDAPVTIIEFSDYL